MQVMLNSSSCLKLVAGVPKILSPPGETKCCHGLGQGTQPCREGLMLRSYRR